MNSVALDVFIGLVFVFLLYSLLATIVQELIAVKFAFRSKVLERAILRMLEDGKTTSNSKIKDRIYGLLNMFGKPNLLKDKSVAPWFYAHPLIKYLGENNYYSKPAYITAQNFSKVLIDLLKGMDDSAVNEIQRIDRSVRNGTIFQLPINLKSDQKNPAIEAITTQRGQSGTDVPIDPLHTVEINKDTSLFLLSLWQQSGADLDKFRLQLEQWFNDTMDRASGWYKRYTQTILLIIGFIMAVAFNVDTIAIHRILSKDDKARAQMVQMAIQANAKYAQTVDSLPANDSLLTKTYKTLLSDANAANDIMGLGWVWTDSCKTCEQIYQDKKFTAAFLDSVKLQKNKKSQLDSLLKLSMANKQSLDATKSKIKRLAALPTSKNNKLAIKKLISETLLVASNQAAIYQRLKQYNERALVDTLKKLTTLEARCPYILSGTWFKFGPNQTGGVETVLGWIITALAISLGAPFWFDLLNKMVKMRGVGTKVTTQTDTNSAANSASNSPIQVNVNTSNNEEAIG